MWGPIAVSGFETGILEKESIKLQSQSVYYLMPNEGTYSYHIDLKCVAENLEYLCDTWKSIAGVEGARLSFYKGSIKKKMSLEHWWNDTGRGKQPLSQWAGSFTSEALYLRGRHPWYALHRKLNRPQRWSRHDGGEKVSLLVNKSGSCSQSTGFHLLDHNR